MPDPVIVVDANFQESENAPNCWRTPNGNLWFIADQHSNKSGVLYKSTDEGLTWVEDVDFTPATDYGGYSIGIWGGSNNKVYCLAEPHSTDSPWGLHFSRAFNGVIEVTDIDILESGRSLDNGFVYSAPMTILERGGQLEAFCITGTGAPDNRRIDRKTSNDDGATWGGLVSYDSGVQATGPAQTIFGTITGSNVMHLIYKAGGTSSSHESWVKHLQVNANDTFSLATIEYTTPSNAKHTIYGVEFDAINNVVVCVYQNWYDDVVRYAYLISGVWTVADLEVLSLSSWPTSQYKLVRLTDNTIWLLRYNTDDGIIARWKWSGSSFVSESTVTISNPESSTYQFRKIFPVQAPTVGSRPAYTAFAYWGIATGAYFYFESTPITSTVPPCDVSTICINPVDWSGIPHTLSIESSWPAPTIPPIPMHRKSTGYKSSLLSGGEVFITPYVKHLPEEVEITWMRRQNRDFTNSLRAHLQSGNFLTITMEWGDTFTGFIKSLREEPILGRRDFVRKGEFDRFIHNLSITFVRKE